MKKELKEEEEALLEEEVDQAEEEQDMEEDDESCLKSSGSRQWQKDNGQNNVNGYNISVGITTRDESLPIYDTPCKMYSSLRYKLHYKCSVDSNQVSQPKLLMCRITVIDDESGKEIKKDNKPIIDDSLISLKNTTTGTFGVFEANHKIKFKSVSFHHNKSKWRLLLQLFSDSNHSINTPVFVMKSAPFQVYARRPKVSERDSTNGMLNAASAQSLKEEKRKKKSEGKKRKRSSSVAPTGKDVKQEEEETEQVAATSSAPEVPVVNPKKIKLMDNFKKTLDLLLKYHSEMDDEDKRAGFDLIQHKMYNHFYDMVSLQQQQMMQNELCSTSEHSEETTLQCGSADDLMLDHFNNQEQPLFSDSHESSELNDQHCGSFESLDYLLAPNMSEDFTPFI